MMIDTPHLAWPLRTYTAPDGSTQFIEVEQGSRAEILGGIALLCDLRVDQLPWDEDLGIPDPLGTTDRDETAVEIEVAINEIEPRLPITVAVVDQPSGRSLQFRLIDDGDVVDMEVRDV